MREYGVLRVSFWTDPELSMMSDAANRLMAYLITGQHTTLIGCFRCPVGYICSDLRWTATKVAEVEKEIGPRLVQREGEWVFLPTYLRWNPIENPNQGKSAARLFQQIPTRLRFHSGVAKALLEQPETLSERFQKGLQDVLEQFRNKDQDQDQKKEQEKDQEQSFAGGSPTAPTKSARAVPAKTSDPSTPGSVTFAAYAREYRQRYGTDPVRNHKVNIAFSDLVKRLGVTEAPEVAAHYVRHNGALYVQSGHAPGLLLRDAEKLRTEWATGRKVNAAAARQREQSEACGFRQIIDEMEREERVEHVDSEVE